MSTPPAAGALEDLADLGPGTKPVDDFDRERKLAHPRREAAMMLLGQDGCRHQHGHLLAGVDGLEGRADGDLGLAVADVAADQAVHRLLLGHVVLGCLDRGELVGRLLERKGGLELGHPVAVLGGIGKPRLAGALGLDVEQLLRQVDDSLGHPLLPLLPGRRADLREHRARPCRRRRTSAPGRSWRSARTAWSPRQTRAAGSPRRARPTDRRTASRDTARCRG